jgi:hypothetical protein
MFLVVPRHHITVDGHFVGATNGDVWSPGFAESFSVPGYSVATPIQPLLQEHVIVSLVRDCYSHAVVWS